MTGYGFLKPLIAVFMLTSRLTFVFAAQPGFAADLYLFREEIFTNDRSAAGGQASISLYRLAGNRLTPVPLNLGPPEYPDFTIADSEMRLLALGASTLPSQVRVMSMDNPAVLTAAEINVPDWGAHFDVVGSHGNPPLLIVRLNNLFESLSGKPEKNLIKKLDTTIGQWEEASPEVYKQLRLTGGIRGFEVDPTGHWYLKQFAEGQLMLAVSQRVFPMGPPLPANLRIPPDGTPLLVLNNSHVSAVRDEKRDILKRPTVYLVLDKSVNQWTRVQVPGDRTWNVRAFGPWMAGLEEEWQGVNKHRLSPGRPKYDDWHKFKTVDDYLEEKRVYRSGILFLYNVKARQYYEWDTHNGDCEVLLVEDGQVYYRVDQAIYRAKIGEKELGKPELLVEDKEVPGIHWAFFGPDVPLQAKPPAERK